MKVVWLLFPLLTSAAGPAGQETLLISQPAKDVDPLQATIALPQDTKIPAGIQNPDTKCYFAALFQALFHLPSFRTRVLERVSDDIVHTCLASFFYRLLVAPANEPVSMDADILPVIRERNKGEGNAFTPSAMDDSHAVWGWLMDKHLLEISNELFVTHTQSQTFLGDVPLSDPFIARENCLEPKVLLTPDLFVEEMVIESTEQPTDYIVDPAGLDGTARAALASIGITSRTPHLEVTIKRTISHTPPILVLHPSKFEFDPNTGVGSWRGDITTKYRPSFDIHGKTFHLHAIIAYDLAHYVTYACTDVRSNTWYRFSDRVVSAHDPTSTIRESPYFLMYVEEGHRASWSDPRSNIIRKPADVPLAYRGLGDIFASLIYGNALLSFLTKLATKDDVYTESRIPTL